MSFSGTIESIRRLTPTTYVVRLHRDPQFVFQAGQHLRLTLGELPSGHEGIPAPGYFSIASPPEGEWIELIVRTSGQAALAADLLVKMSPGQRVMLEGPFGDFLFLPAPHRHACFLAQGTGVAPMLSILRSRAFSDSAPLSVLFLAGFREESELIQLEPFGPALPAVDYRVTLSQPKGPSWSGLRGRVTDHLKRGTVEIDWQNTEFYLCGSAEMVWDVKAILAAHGVDSTSIHSD